VQEGDPVEVGGRAQGIAAAEQLRTADRKKLLGTEAGDVQSRCGAVAVTNGEVDVLAREVHMMKRRAYPQIDLGMGLDEAAQPMNQPLRRKVRGGADGERAAALTLQQPLGSIGDAVEGIAQDNEIGAARLGDDQALALAVEQLEPKLGFERLSPDG
jgi:hypothetical protein